jgi:DNA-binding beta-propeller fold protein YncE
MTYRLFALLGVSLALLTIGCDTPTDGGQPPVETTQYVADKMNDRIVMLDSEGNIKKISEVVTRPTDLSLYPGVDYLWVADYSRDRVIKLDLDLEFVVTTEEGLLNDPITVSVTADGECWVADRVNHSFVRLSSDAVELGRVTVDGPTRCVAYDEANGYCWCADEDGNLYAFDADLTGDKTAADARVTVAGLGVTRGLAVDPDGDQIWASDMEGDYIYCLDETGGEVFTVNDINDPWGLSLDSDGNCWVAQRGGGRAVLLLFAEDGSVLENYDGLDGPVDVAAEPAGGVWAVLETGGSVVLLRNGDTVLTVEGFSSPAAIEVYDPELW